MHTHHQPVAVDHVFNALADSSRRLLLEKLATSGGASASDLAAQMTISRQAISKHLSILTAAGLVSRSRRGKAVIFHAEPAQLAATGRWMQRIAQRWEASAEPIEPASAAATSSTPA